MKQTDATTAFLENHAQWLAQFDSAHLLLKMLALCDWTGFYILDNTQKVLYWSSGAERLTGFKRSELLGKPCPPECEVLAPESDRHDALSHTSVSIALTPANNPIRQSTSLQKITLKKITQALYAPLSSQDSPADSVEERFAGGWGLLVPIEQTDSDYPQSLPTPASLTQPTTLPNNATDKRYNFQGILSRSPAMQDVFYIIKNAAETTATVLVRGESGAGKELVARAIHDLSVRRNAPFLAINCAALSSNLLESELFGHVRGAFTGAIKDHNGLFQRAQGGTLFLDEVAELPLELQAKLLRVIQERNYIPVGGAQQINTDVRLVAATHRSLREEVKHGRFREDLMYRLRVVPLFIPPLRERREDISLLLWHFIGQHNRDNFRNIEKIEPQAMRTLLDYQWPGNVRELHNVIEYAFAVGRGTTLRYGELPPEFREARVPEHAIPQNKPARPLTPEQELAVIRQALAQHNGLITLAAEAAGMSRATFWRKRKRYGL